MITAKIKVFIGLSHENFNLVEEGRTYGGEDNNLVGGNLQGIFFLVEAMNKIFGWWVRLPLSPSRENPEY